MWKASFLDLVVQDFGPANRTYDDVVALRVISTPGWTVEFMQRRLPLPPPTPPQCRQKKNIIKETNQKQLEVLREMSSWCLQDLGSSSNRTKVCSRLPDVATGLVLVSGVLILSGPAGVRDCLSPGPTYFYLVPTPTRRPVFWNNPSDR